MVWNNNRLLIFWKLNIFSGEELIKILILNLIPFVNKKLFVGFYETILEFI